MKEFARLASDYSLSMSSIASMLEVLIAADDRRDQSVAGDLAKDEKLSFVLKGLTDEERHALHRYFSSVAESIPHLIDRSFEADSGASSKTPDPALRDLDEVSKRISAHYDDSPPRARAAGRILERKLRRDSLGVLHSLRTREAILVTLVTHFEVLVGEIVRQYFRRVPEALKAKDKVVSWREAISMRSMRALRDHLISEEVDSALKGTIEDWRKYLLKQIGVDIKAFASDWDSFRECFYRRNLIVHTAGFVNRRYLRSFSIDRGREGGHVLQPNDRVVTSLEYLAEAIETFEGIGLALIFSTWRHLYPKKTQSADRELYSSIESVLMDERYHSAMTLCYSRMKGKDLRYDTSVILLLSIAYAMRQIEGDDFSEHEALLELELNGAPLRWQMAKSAILHNWDDFYLLANSARPTNFSEEEWDSFPFFKEAWADPRYDEAWRSYLEGSGYAS